jgi:glycosyltransferase involved in cell wall biosynthesis
MLDTVTPQAAKAAMGGVDPGIDLSVVICTHDRYDALSRSIGQLLACADFSDRCELLVVENTPSSRRRPIPLPARKNLRRTICETQGLSPARNHGIGEARGEIIAFLDDDALVLPGWCAAILRRMHDEARLLAVGGKVVPHYDSETLPPWYDERLAGYLSCIDWGMTPRYLRAGEWVVGANIAFRRDVFAQYGLFDVNLGRRGTASLLSNEETALLARIGLDRVFYDPAIAVRHVIPVERLTARWFRRRVYWQAISDLVAGHVRDDDPGLRREYGELIVQLEPEHRNLRAFTFEPADAAQFALQLRAIYLAAVMMGGGGAAEAQG